MNKLSLNRGLRFGAVSLAFLVASVIAVAQTSRYSVIDNLGTHPGDGTYPQTSVVFDRSGNLFGLTTNSKGPGIPFASTAFELTPKGDGRWTERTIARFPTNGGATGPLVVDAEGNLYGAQEGGGTEKVGTVFELSPTDRGLWKKTVLYNFRKQSDGEHPWTGLVIDKAGNLFGTTISGGLNDGGTIFELSHQEDGSWTETLIYNLDNRNGSPIGLTVDQAGNLYGAVNSSLGECSAVIFSLTKPESEGGSWSYTTLHTFQRLDGAHARGDAGCPSNVIVDAEGNLYGTSSGGGTLGYGAVFEIPAGGGADGPDKLLYSFDSLRMYQALATALVIDGSGNLYGTMSGGGPYVKPNGGGKIFELLPRKNASWSIRDLHNFGGRTYRGIKGADGFHPEAGLVIGPDGNFYGTTFAGGYHPGEAEGDNNPGYGTVFKFVVH